ncbi:hypothetical protein VTI74DRAFT_10491 [Chaetomium olivicolor]
MVQKATQRWASGHLDLFDTLLASYDSAEAITWLARRRKTSSTLSRLLSVTSPRTQKVILSTNFKTNRTPPDSIISLQAPSPFQLRLAQPHTYSLTIPYSPPTETERTTEESLDDQLRISPLQESRRPPKRGVHVAAYASSLHWVQGCRYRFHLDRSSASRRQGDRGSLSFFSGGPSR